MADNSSTRDNADGDARRSFLKGAAVAAGAAATVAIAKDASAQTRFEAKLHPDGHPAVERIASPAVMNVAIHSSNKVTIDLIQDLVRESLGRTGCPTCGLVGLDIRLGLDEVILAETELATVALQGGRNY